MVPKKILLLGSGELGKEFVISAKRLGQHVVAVDRYARAPAMQVADEFEIIDMLNPQQLAEVVHRHQPDIIVPEIEAICTAKLKDFERHGVFVVPTAEAAHLTMNRDAIRDVAYQELKLKTARYAYATSIDELRTACHEVGFPCVIKPVMSSSGKGQSVARNHKDLDKSWQLACSGMRGNQQKVIVEEFIAFDFEITLLTIKQHKAKTLFLPPIGHRQEQGDYRESWLPAKMKPAQLRQAQNMAKKITDRLGGAGIFGVEFFVSKTAVYFSELSPRPHDTGMVTLISQDLSEFDLHLRAILGLPIPKINFYGPSASAVILAPKASPQVKAYKGVEKALQVANTEVRIFGKPETKALRRMGVALARAKTVTEARKKARQAATQVSVQV